MPQVQRACTVTLLLLIAWLACASPSHGSVGAAPERADALTPRVQIRAAQLLADALSRPSAPAIINRLRAAHSDPAFTALEQDAVLFVFLQELRTLSAGSIPVDVLQWMQALPPKAVTGHEEGGHHPVAVFNVAAQSRGLLNQWAWQDGHDAVAGPDRLEPAALADVLARTPQHHPLARGIRRGLQRLTPPELDRLAAACAATPSGCGAARADVELARGNSGWLSVWLATATAADALPRLREARRTWPEEAALALSRSAVNHPDKGVAGWAINDVSVHLPKDATVRRAWVGQLVKLLADETMGSAAALQLARFDRAEWIEAASAQALDELARRRLSLITEAEAIRRQTSTER